MKRGRPCFKYASLDLMAGLTFFLFFSFFLFFFISLFLFFFFFSPSSFPPSHGVLIVLDFFPLHCTHPPGSLLFVSQCLIPDFIFTTFVVLRSHFASNQMALFSRPTARPTEAKLKLDPTRQTRPLIVKGQRGGADKKTRSWLLEAKTGGRQLFSSRLSFFAANDVPPLLKFFFCFDRASSLGHLSADSLSLDSNGRKFKVP